MLSTAPYLSLNVLSHPSDLLGVDAAMALCDHFERDLYQEVAGDAEVLVMHQSHPDAAALDPIGWDESEITVVVPVIGSAIASDDAWSNYVVNCVHQATVKGALVLPVMVEDIVSELPLGVQAVRLDRWHGTAGDRCRRLVREVTLEVIRYLRHRLHQRTRPTDSEASLSDYGRKVQVFISHSKHDDDGERVALALRSGLHHHSALQGLIDVHDIPAGLPFDEVLLHQVRNSAVLAIHTDSFSSREWCRREMIEAKQHMVPLVVVDCLRDRDEHCMPYLGGVPVVRMCPEQCDRVEVVVQRLLDEMFMSYLWDNRTRGLQGRFADVHFMYRPPELLSLTAAELSPPSDLSEIVYSGPILHADDLRVIEQLVPNVKAVHVDQWGRG